MKVQVRFRFNKRTGEVEEFLVDDYASNLNGPEHNLLHDRISREVGQVIAQHPQISEIHLSDIFNPAQSEDKEGESEELQAIREQKLQQK